MRNTYMWGAGLAVAGLAGWLLLPRAMPKARLAIRRVVAVPYVSGVPGTGRATADPARGNPA